MSCVTFHVSPVTCQLSPTSTATDPPHPNSPIMQSRLVSLKPKPKITKILQNPKIVKTHFFF